MPGSLRPGVTVVVLAAATTLLAGSVAAAAQPPVRSGETAGGTAAAAPPATGPGTGIAPGTQFTPIAASVLTTPMAVLGSDGRRHIAYELTLSNEAAFTMHIRAVKVRDPAGKRTLLTLRGSELRDHMRTLATATVEGAGNTTIESSATSVVYLDVSLPRKAVVPRRVVHRIVAVGSPGGTQTTFRMRLIRTTLSTKQPVVLHSPLAAGKWLASEGCCTNFGHHRWGTVPVNGTLVVPQRFAIDFFRLDAQNRTWVGDPSDVTSYLSYNQKVIAAAPGKVVAATDVLPDQAPPEPPPVTPIADSVGNHVILKVGKGVYLLYAHMRPGSVKVKVGQRLRLGQTIGRVGTSGNSTTPHLHFQVLTEPTFFPTDSTPYVFNEFRLVGTETARIWDDNIGLQPTGKIPVGAVPNPGVHRRQLPLDRSVIVLGRG